MKKITFDEFLRFVTEEVKIPELTAYVKNGPALTVEQIYNNIPRASWYSAIYRILDCDRLSNFNTQVGFAEDEANSTLLHRAEAAIAAYIVCVNSCPSDYTESFFAYQANLGNRMLEFFNKHLEITRLPWLDVEPQLAWFAENFYREGETK